MQLNVRLISMRYPSSSFFRNKSLTVFCFDFLSKTWYSDDYNTITNF